MNAGSGWGGRRDVHGYCGASEESTIQRGRQCRRAGHSTQGTDSTVTVWPCAACRIVSSVRRRVSSARPVDVKSQTTKGPGTVRHSKPPTSREYSGPRLGSVQPPSTQCMHARMHAHTHSRTDTHTGAKRKQTRYTMADRRGRCILSPLEQAHARERASDQLRVGKGPRRMQSRGDSR